MSFDSNCLDRAGHFLEDYFGDETPEELANRLAQHIQEEIEIWLEVEKHRLKKESKKRQPNTP